MAALSWSFTRLLALLDAGLVGGGPNLVGELLPELALVARCSTPGLGRAEEVVLDEH